jgi:two-component system response regulator FixJ
MLRTSGYEVEPFALGQELLKAAKDLDPGCILLDVRMPGMDGLEVQQELRARGIAFPVVVMTGHGDIDVAVRAMKAGAVDFIEKPFEKSVLLDAIAESCTRLAQSERNKTRADEANVRLEALTPRRRSPTISASVPARWKFTAPTS